MMEVDIETILTVATVIVAEGFNGYVLCLYAGGWMIDKQRKVRRVVLIKRLSGQGRFRMLVRSWRQSLHSDD